MCELCICAQMLFFLFYIYTNSLRGSMWVNLYICISVYNVFFFSHIDSRGVYDALFPFVHIFFSFLNILSFFTYTFLFYIY